MKSLFEEHGGKGTFFLVVSTAGIYFLVSDSAVWLAVSVYGRHGTSGYECQ